MRLSLILLVFLLSNCILLAQKDSLLKKNKTDFFVTKDTAFEIQNIRIIDRIDTAEHPHMEIGGYVSTYYAYYNDETNKGEFVQFPTICPRHNQFSLNMAMISLQYRSRNLRSNLIFHYGDIPQSSWPSEFNLIQEANAGFRVIDNLWFDAGFFKTHVGLESFQPRENICSSMAIASFYEPYYLSGIKLTYELSSKLILQANAFNGYNEYIDNNKNKALGISCVFTPNKNIVFTYNLLTCDESADSAKIKKPRIYNNFYTTLNLRKMQIGFEANYGLQQNSLKANISKPAFMYSGLLVAKYLVLPKFSLYGREEFFSDKDQILANDIQMGNYIYGTTGGMEYHPFKNIAMSLESRMLMSDKLIFKQGKNITNQRLEFIACIDLWF